VNISLDTAGPCDPGYFLEVAEAFAEAARVMNYLTLSHEALEFPAEADTLLRYVSTAAARLPQLVDQVARWYAVEQARGRLRSDDGRGTAAAAAHVRAHLDRAAIAAAQLQSDVDAATAVTTHLGATGQGEPGDA
jgi:hypothetical protein